jgi:hypothetical protein
MTAFYVWGVFAGRRSGRTNRASYRMRLYPLLPLLGIVIVVGEVAAQWLDRDIGRPALLIWLGIFLLSYLYYRLVLMRRPTGWRMEGPRDIDAEALASPGTEDTNIHLRENQ